MTKNNKAFTLAELMVVMAIIGMLTAAAVTIFSGAQAQARDSRRIADLNTISSAIESYYLKNHFYPQPALQTKNNLWGYVVNSIAAPTCSVKLIKNPDGTSTDEIDYSATSNICGGDIKVTKRKVNSFDCNFEITRQNGTKDTQTVNPNTDLTYEGDSLKDLCTEYYENSEYGLMQPGDSYTFVVENINYNENDKKEIVIGWKGTLTELSGKNSIFFNSENQIEERFYGFLKEQNIDPKYSASKYSNYGLGFYPYAVFRDNVGLDNSGAKSRIGGTQYQIAATLEKQDEDNQIHPETLVVGNYKTKTGYPRSLIGNGNNVLVSGQKQGEKGKFVAKPDMVSNWGIPYLVEEIQ